MANKRGEYGLKTINGKPVKNWLTMPNGQKVVLGKGEITDYGRPNLGTDGSGTGEYGFLYEYLTNKKQEIKKEQKRFLEENEKKESTYSCPECGNEIKKSDSRCTKCKVALDWT